MLTAGDFVHLPYTPDLTQAGIHYACLSLASSRDPVPDVGFDHLRGIIAGKATELAFRRKLTALEVPFDNLSETPFTAPEEYRVALGERRCDLISIPVFQKSKFQSFSQHPEQLLTTAALIPEKELFASHFSDLDLFIFAFVLAQIKPRLADQRQANQLGLPLYLVHPLPERWSQPAAWAPFGELLLKNELPPELNIELGGQDSQHHWITEQMQLPAGESCRASLGFHTLAYLHTGEIPTGRVSLHSPRPSKTQVIQPLEWGNIWVYGLEIILVGWMSRGEFRQQAARPRGGSRTSFSPHQHAPNRFLPVAQLHPLQTLFESTRAWAAEQPWRLRKSHAK